MRDPADILEVERLTIRFGETELVRSLDFSVRRGGVVAIIGPNGCGKTVLFRALIGLIPHEGEIRWAPDARIGYVPQKLDLERDLPLTAMDLLSAQARIAKRDRSAVDEVTATVDFPEAMRARPIARLSGGHFQRLLVACVLLGSPTVLLLLGWAEIEVREGPSGTVELTVPTGHRHGMKPT